MCITESGTYDESSAVTAWQMDRRGHSEMIYRVFCDVNRALIGKDMKV